MADGEANWIRIQRKTFTRWCNTFLINRNMAIAIMEKDLSDGVYLHNLMELLSGEAINPKPKKGAGLLRVQKVENINRVIRYIQARGLKVVGIGGQDICDGNTKLTLGLIWTLILRFQIQAGDDAGTKQDLLDWCNKVLNPQGVEVQNFKDSWQDGRAFCGLVNALEAGTVNLSERTSDKAEQNLTLAFDLAEQHFQFPKMLDAADVLEYPDELSIMCYVSYFRGYLASNTAHAASCYATGDGLKQAMVMKPGEFKVFVLNDQGEQASRGGAPVRAFLKDDEGNDICRVNILDNRDGTYSCSYEAPRPGSFVLNVRIAKEEIKDSPFRPSVISGEPCPSKCVASGPGIKGATAGVQTHFTIHSKDMNGNDMDKGGFQVAASLEDPSGTIPVSVADNGNGTYSCTYTPKTSGPIKLSVSMTTEAFGTSEIENAPFTVDISPAGADPNNSEATGPGLGGASAGEVGVITVHTKDTFGNVCKTGGAPVCVNFVHVGSKSSSTASVASTAAPNADVTVKDNKDGTYTVEYKPKKVGEHKLEISIGETPIKNSPIEFSVLPGIPSALNFDLSGLELDSNGRRVVVAGTTDKYTVRSRDAFGNPLTAGGLNLNGKIDGPKEVDFLACDNGDGSYEITYTPSVVGDYNLTVTLDGEKIGGSSEKNPFKFVVIPDKASGEFSTAYGPGLERAAVGEDNEFTVQTADKFGNKVTVGGAKVGGKLTLVGSDVEVPIVAVDNGDGTYTCKYPSVSKTGKYQVVPTVEGIPVKGAPFEVTVTPGLYSLDNTLVTFDDSAVAGLPGAHVHLRDKFGNILFSGGDIVEASLLPLEVVPVAARDKGDGSYDLIYPPHFRGEYDVVVKVNDKPAPGGPWKVDVKPNPVPQEQSDQIKQLVPKNSGLWERLLADATNNERQLILKELTSLVNKTPFEVSPAVENLPPPEPVLTLPAQEGDGGSGFSKPKKPGQRAPTVNTIQDRQEKEKQSQELRQQEQQSPQQEPQQKRIPAGARPGFGLSAIGAEVALKRAKEQEAKGIKYDSVAVEGKGAEVQEIKHESPSQAGPKFSYGMTSGDPRAALKKTGSTSTQPSSQNS